MTRAGGTGSSSMRLANQRSSDRAFAIALTALVALLLAIGAARHEIWRDEAKAWVIARDSGSLPELLANTEREGHPLAWPLLLFGLTVDKMFDPDDEEAGK